MSAQPAPRTTPPAYHLSPFTGNVVACHKPEECPFTDHGRTREATQRIFEEQMRPYTVPYALRKMRNEGGQWIVVELHH